MGCGLLGHLKLWQLNLYSYLSSSLEIGVTLCVCVCVCVCVYERGSSIGTVEGLFQLYQGHSSQEVYTHSGQCGQSKQIIQDPALGCCV